jgi:hypothetical protein
MITEMSKQEVRIQWAKIILLAALVVIAGVVGLRPSPVHAQLAGAGGFKYVSISTATCTTVASAPAMLGTITITGGTGGTITVYDNASACSGTIIAGPILAVTAPVTLSPLVQSTAGISVTTAAATDVTIGVK